MIDVADVQKWSAPQRRLDRRGGSRQSLHNTNALVHSELIIDASVHIQGVECSAEVPPPGNLIEIKLCFENPLNSG